MIPLIATAGPMLTKDIQLDADTELSVSIYSAPGSTRILWIPAYATPISTVESIATQLNKLNIEVWHADILEARFLPKTASSVYKIPEQDIIKIIKASEKDKNRKLFLFAESRAVIPVLHALRNLQLSGTYQASIGGVIMNSPYFFVETPEPGIDAEIMPIVTATNLPIYIFQPKNSPRYWQLGQRVMGALCLGLSAR